MTVEHKRNVQSLRLEGKSYLQISASLGLSVNTIKSFCKRNSLSTAAISKAKESCKQCGKPLNASARASRKTFCGDNCRFTWWNKHRGENNRKSIITRECAYCGAGFDDYENRQRKFCCHACYVQARFGKEVNA